MNMKQKTATAIAASLGAFAGSYGIAAAATDDAPAPQAEVDVTEVSDEAVLSTTDAETAALEAVGAGTVVETELDEEAGALVYEVEIVASDQREVEVIVDAVDGTARVDLDDDDDDIDDDDMEDGDNEDTDDDTDDDDDTDN